MKTMKKHLFLSVAFLTLMACHDSETTDEKEPTTAAPIVAATVAVTDANTQQITQPCAVFYSPDSAQLAKLQIDNGEEAFYTIADDYQNYMADARLFLEDKGLKIMEPTGGKISFRAKNGQVTTLNLGDLKYNWEVWLFDGNQLHKVDVTDIENEYKQYMK
ncbi:hypothetical protein [Chitinophaga sp. 30R24]|uniref:hypothetical protein n=1 Tax=Chitinophaga sp. 30R24 TaxID=3248838 RepID=UPI003B97F0E1